MISTLGAITRLGIRETRNLVVTSAVIHVLPNKNSNFNLRDFWTLGLASAICARQISRDLRCPVSDEAYLGGLVHCLGEAVLAVYFPIRFDKALDRARSESIDLVQAVWAEFGFTHPVLVCKVLERWNFPRPVVEAVEYLLAPDAERSWVAEIPGEFTSLLLETSFPDLDTYVTEQKDHLKEVGTPVSSLFSGS
ncbi:MAG: HDOD domain-containing protein [Myxococcales bacterium]|nr:HDOD domain-containing protein [Myxococcales bacterium]TDJ08571.1 MAG: HDOD domain-containing protein [Deltaproteobacteria bacterium]